MRVEACACGGRIEATNLEESAPAVALHNCSPLHQIWRSRGGLDLPDFEIPEFPPIRQRPPFDAYERRRIV